MNNKSKPTNNMASHKGERLAKRMARAGLCSRREGEAIISAGRVKVNGQRVTTPALNVTGGDTVEVDNIALPDKPPLMMYRYYKPRGLVTTRSDEKGRASIFDHLPRDMPRLISVGRLDMNSEGLLLLTNDGELAGHLEHPDTGWTRQYRVRVHGEVDGTILARLSEGVRVDGVDYAPIDAQLEQQRGSNAWLYIRLSEGKNREIRKIFEHFGYPVNRLIRVRYGPFQLGNLKQGHVAPVKTAQLRELLPTPFKKRV
jgi:23S rRNA pseudouridine2605 synthase